MTEKAVSTIPRITGMVQPVAFTIDTARNAAREKLKNNLNEAKP